MRAATYYAALALGEGFDDAPEAVATAGAYVFDAFAHLCGEALQLHGGIGFTWEHDVHLFVRRAKVNQVLYGDGSWHREQLVRLLERTNAERRREPDGCDRPRDSRYLRRVPPAPAPAHCRATTDVGMEATNVDCVPPR